MTELFNANAALDAETVALTNGAARGDLAAQRALRDRCLSSMGDKVREGALAEGHAHALEAMIWARLAASHGAVDDAITLAASLAYLSEYWGYDREGQLLGNFMLSEAIAIMDRLASDGDEIGAGAVTLIAGEVAPHILQQAKQIREAVDAGR